MYRFFVDKAQIEGENIHVTGSDTNHIRNVLRMQRGEKLLISDREDSEYECEIEAFLEDEIILRILDMRKAAIELPSKLYLFQGLPKSDKMELIIQKAVELGVYEVIPVATKRSIVKLDAKKEASKIKRWQTIAEGAAKQSKRMIIPKVGGVATFDEALKRADSLDVILIPYELAENMEQTRAVLGSVKRGERVGIFIGPEGGFSEEEITLALSHKARAITLGRRILRTETAGLSVLSILGYLLEE